VGTTSGLFVVADRTAYRVADSCRRVIVMFTTKISENVSSA